MASQKSADFKSTLYHLASHAILILLIQVELTASQNNCQDFNFKPRVCFPGPENLIRGRIMHVTPNGSTCGTPASGYCRPKPRNGCYKCNSSNPSENHGPEKMGDNDPLSSYWDYSGFKPTWWQSITWWDARQRGLLVDNTVKVNLTLSINKSYDLTGDIKITFYSSKPNAMIIERSSDFGNTWRPFRYYADNCRTRFGASVPTIPANNFQAYCVEKSNAAAVQGSSIALNPMERFSATNFWQPSIQQYVVATDIRIRLEYPWTDGNHVIQQENYQNQYYYDVTDIQIFGRCHCSGHAPHCMGPFNQLYCDCQHFTTGVNCERCLPLYNNRTWRAAEASDRPNACEKCECNNHAQSCVYNSTFGFGVCSDCSHNTTGFFCHKCQDKFYRNLSQPLNNQKACSSCDCFAPGMTNNGSCAQAATTNVTIGQCSCKGNFRGRRCDSCQDGFYGVTVVPIGECKSCNCSSLGSVNSSIICHQISGQCQCKASINGRTCSICKDGFHSFPNDTAGECQSCICDPGGAYSNTCNKTAGHCFCRNGIEGMSCDTTVNGYFIPAFDYLRTEGEISSGNYQIISNITGHGSVFTGFGYAKISSMGQVTAYFQPRFTSNYYVVIRYKHLLQQQLHLTASFHYNNNSISLLIKSYNVTLPASTGSSSMVFYHAEPTMLLQNGNYSVTLSFANSTNVNQTLDIDSIVLMWDYQGSKFYGAANQTMKNMTKLCWENEQRVSLDSQDSLTCQKIAFSVNAELFNGSLACDCNVIGTVNNTNCAKYGGQCQCKPGVMGRKCDQCRPGFYNFTNNGCTACDCTILGSQNLVCDVATGQCPCKPGVVNRTCSACRSSFFGYQTGLGCRNCSCNWDGSAIIFCDKDGICPCKNTTTGPKCDRCKPLHFNFTSNGCMPCNCNPSGSINLQCDLQNGNCSCKQNVQGNKCSNCKSRTFGLQATNSHGCQPCFCFNKTDQCDSSSGFYSLGIQSTFNNTADGWQLKTLNGLNSVYSNTTSGLLFRPVDSTPVLLHAPINYLGNKLSSYAQSFTVRFSLTSGIISPTIQILLVLSHTDNSQVSFAMPVNTSLPQQTTSVRLHEINSVERVTAWALQHILSSIKSLSIQFNTTGISSITIESVRLASASSSVVSSAVATYVENCSCPVNFTGNSCSRCAPGYTREFPNNGSYTICRLCACNSRSTTCDPQNGFCSNCRLGTEGSQCERCQPGVLEPNCNKCIPGFYGFNDTSFPGCRACNCMLVNTINGNSSICNEVTGQCSCRPNIGGRQCDRCAENAVNTTYAGCQTCSECYRLIQVEVHTLRRDITNITNSLSSVQSITQLSLSPSFGDRLASLTTNVRQLYVSAQNSSGIESGLVVELAALNFSLDAMQRTLEQNVSNGINQTNANMVVINATRNQMIGLRGAIYQLLWASNYVLQRDVSGKKNTTDVLKDELDAVSKNMTALWGRYQRQYTTAASQNAQIISLTSNTTNTTSEITAVSNEASRVVNTSGLVLRQQRSSLQGLQSSINLLQANLTELMRNITQLSQRSNITLANSEALNASTNPSLVDLQTRFNSLTSSLVALNSTLARLQNDYVMIRSNLTSYNSSTNAMRATLSTAEAETSTLAAQANNAQTVADNAVTTSRNVLKEAEDMLRIVQNFNETSRAAENMAAVSLRHTSEVNQTSLQAIRYTNSIKADLNVAVSLASQSLVISQNASSMAGNLSQTLDSLLNSSRRLRSEAYISPYRDNYFTNIRNNVSTSATNTVQPRSSECQNYSSNAKLSLANASQARLSAANLSAEVEAKQVELNRVIQDFQRLTRLNATSLSLLQQTLRQNRAKFDASNVKTMVAQLRDSYASQQRSITEYKATITRLRTEIADNKRLVDEIATLQGCS